MPIRGTKAQRKFRSLVLEDLQQKCESQKGWPTWKPSEKLDFRLFKLLSFELNDSSRFSSEMATRIKRKLRAHSVRAWDGWPADFGILLLIAIEATRHVNRIARSDPAFAKKFANLLSNWPLMCKNAAKLSAGQCEMLDEIGLIKPKEFRVGGARAARSNGVVSHEAEFIYWLLHDEWRIRQKLQRESGSGMLAMFLGKRLRPRWFEKQRAEVYETLRSSDDMCQVLQKIREQLFEVQSLPLPTDETTRSEWVNCGVQIYTLLLDANISLATGCVGSRDDSPREARNKRLGLFKKAFASLMEAKPGAGRPRKKRKQNE